MISGTRQHEHIYPILVSPHGLHVHFGILFKIIVFALNFLNGLALLIWATTPLYSSRSLRSADQLLLKVWKTLCELKREWIWILTSKMCNEVLQCHRASVDEIFTEMSFQYSQIWLFDMHNFLFSILHNFTTGYWIILSLFSTQLQITELSELMSFLLTFIWCNLKFWLEIGHSPISLSAFQKCIILRLHKTVGFSFQMSV